MKEKVKEVGSLCDWCGGGLNLISFEAGAEFAALQVVLGSLTSHGKLVVLIQSKTYRRPTPQIAIIDATGHALTPRQSLRRRLSEEGGIVVDNPADIQGLLSQLSRQAQALPGRWWVWCSPSDLVSHGVEEMEMAKCLRAIAKDFEDTPFLILVARDVHTERSFAILKFLSQVHLEFERQLGTGGGEQGELKRHGYRYILRVVKHPNLQLEGSEVELVGGTV